MEANPCQGGQVGHHPDDAADAYARNLQEPTKEARKGLKGGGRVGDHEED